MSMIQLSRHISSFVFIIAQSWHMSPLSVIASVDQTVYQTTYECLFLAPVQSGHKSDGVLPASKHYIASLTSNLSTWRMTSFPDLCSVGSPGYHFRHGTGTEQAITFDISVPWLWPHEPDRRRPRNELIDCLGLPLTYAACPTADWDRFKWCGRTRPPQIEVFTKFHIFKGGWIGTEI